MGVQQTIKSGSRIGQCDVVDAVFDLPAIAVILPLDTGCLIAALGRSRFVNAADCLGVCMLDGDDLLTTISQYLFIPDDGLKEPLQCPGGHILIQRNGFSVFTLHI